MFLPGRVRVGNQEILFRELVWQAYMARVSLSSTGFYKTPKIHWDRARGRGRPFYYFAYGAAVSEVAIDTLTGEYKVLRVDILHDVGRSLNPAIDIGQIEGGFVQGMGWLTTEELWWDREGHLRTHAPSTYKIPACSDRPQVFNVRLLESAENREDTIFKSKAVGEPPLMLAISVLHALSDAIASTADHRLCPRLDPPATPEKVLTYHRAPPGARPRRGRPRMTALAPLAPAAADRAGAGRAGAGRGRQGLDPARGRHRHAGHRAARPTARSAAGGSSGRRPPRRAAMLASGGRGEHAQAAARARGRPVLRRQRHARAAARRCAPTSTRSRRSRRSWRSACRWCCCSARATSAARSPGRWRPCRCGCAGSTTGRRSSPTRRSTGPEVVLTERWLAEVEAAPAGAAYFVMTYSHGLDFEICEAVLRRGDFAYLGLIGSRSKRARFEHGWRELGLDDGPDRAPGLPDRRPAPRQAAAGDRGARGGRGPACPRRGGGRRADDGGGCGMTERARSTAPPRLELEGITKRFPGVVANDRGQLRGGTGRDPRAARRERRRQVDAGQDHLRRAARRRGHGALAGRAGPDRRPARRARARHRHGVPALLAVRGDDRAREHRARRRRRRPTCGRSPAGSSRSRTPTACRSTPRARSTRSRSASASGSRSCAASCRARSS